MGKTIPFHPAPLLRALFTALLAIAAFFAAPAGAGAGSIYVTSGDTIDQVSSTGVVSLFATLPSGSDPQGLAFDVRGNLYAAGNTTDQITRITPSGVQI